MWGLFLAARSKQEIAEKRKELEQRIADISGQVQQKTTGGQPQANKGTLLSLLCRLL